jgi:hypothetical protein
MKLAKAAVDLFSLTIGKPAPGEVENVMWNNPPSPNFLASGFTVARLLISTPDVSIISIPPDGVRITRFEDDKGIKHDTTIYQDSRVSSFAPWSSASTSPDGQQALLQVSLTSAPSPGATKCTLAGTVRARVSKNEHSDESTPAPLMKNSSIKVGPFDCRIVELRQLPAMTPTAPPSQTEALVHIQGNVSRIRWVELIDAATNQSLSDRRDLWGGMNNDEYRDQLTTTTTQIFLRTAQVPEKVMLRIRSYDRAEIVEIPFEVTTGIGL